MKILLKKDVGICLGIGKRGQGAQGCSSWDAWAVALLPTPSSLIPQLLTSRMKRRNLPNSHYYQQSSQEFQVGKRNPRECNCSYKGPRLFLEPRILLPNCGGGQQPCRFCTNLALCLFSCSAMTRWPGPLHPMFMATLFTKLQIWKLPKCLRKDEWIMKRWNRDTMEH